MPSADPMPEGAAQMNNQEDITTEQPDASPAPGPRASQFISLYENALSKTIRTISYESFAACFPTIAENAPEVLRPLHRDMTERFQAFAMREFDQIMRNLTVIENLNALDELLSDAKRRKARAVEGESPPTAPHLLPMSSILAAHLAPQLTSQQSQLNAKIQTVQSQNASIFKTIQAQRAEIEALVRGLESTITDLDNANEGLNRAVPALKRITRDADVEMSSL